MNGVTYLQNKLNRFSELTLDSPEPNGRGETDAS